MSFAPVTAVAIVAATVIRTGSQMALVWTVIHGSAAMSSRTWTGRIDCRNASKKPTRSVVVPEACLPAVLAFDRLAAVAGKESRIERRQQSTGAYADIRTASACGQRFRQSREDE